MAAKMESEQKIVSVYEIEESPINARTMNEKTMRRLVSNIKKDGILTSSVLLMRQKNKSKYMCISGHHRIKAAKKANVLMIPAIIIDEIDESHRTALQISHNDINGYDDISILSEMIDKINEIDIDMISDEHIHIPEKGQDVIDYSLVPYKYVNICLMPETAEHFQMLVDDMANDDDAINYLTTAENYDKLKEVLTKAFRAGFKTAGRAFRHMMEVYTGGTESNKKEK